MTVDEALTLMIAFGLLIVALLSFHNKEVDPLEFGQPGGLLLSDPYSRPPLKAIYCMTVDVNSIRGHY